MQAGSTSCAYIKDSCPRPIGCLMRFCSNGISQAFRSLTTMHFALGCFQMQADGSSRQSDQLLCRRRICSYSDGGLPDAVLQRWRHARAQTIALSSDLQLGASQQSHSFASCPIHPCISGQPPPGLSSPGPLVVARLTTLEPHLLYSYPLSAPANSCNTHTASALA